MQPATLNPTIRVVSLPDFLRANPRGVMALPRAKDFLRDILKQTQGVSRPMPILLDMRGVARLLPPEDTLTLANQARDLGYSGQRIAIVYQPDEREERAALVSLLAHNRALEVRAFTDFEVAVHWLELGEWPAQSPGAQL